MKEETNEPQQTASTFTEAEMNEMHGNARLNFYADAQEAKQELNRRYAKMVNTFGSYKQMPSGVKYILQQDYAGHKAKWGENGTEMVKRFGAAEPAQVTGTNDAKPEQPANDRSQLRQEFLQKVQEQRQQTQSRKLECEL